MKKTIFTLAAAMFVAGTILSGCSSPEQKVENAKEDVKDAKQDLSQAQNEAAATEFQKFKNESNSRIAVNENRIAELKAEMKTESTESRERDEKKIDALEKRNHELKQRLEAYNDDGKSDWQEFKKEFNHDMEGIGDAFKDITVRNTK
jgi:outer membrane murein-binding lipoprotein Lpp